MIVLKKLLKYLKMVVAPSRRVSILYIILGIVHAHSDHILAGIKREMSQAAFEQLLLVVFKSL